MQDVDNVFRRRMIMRMIEIMKRRIMDERRFRFMGRI